MLPQVVGVGLDGIVFGAGFTGSLDVFFDDWRTWSVAVDEDEPFTLRWPKRLSTRLDGVATVVISADDEEIFRDDVRFGDSDARVELMGRHGSRIFIDKWGLIQRPFDERRESGAVDAIAANAVRVLDFLKTELDIDAWISFGTLLGAARSGSVIGHDSDIDLCYLTEKVAPAEMAIELWQIARTLTKAGWEVRHKTSSFITIMFQAPDGGVDGIDLYTCFYLDGLLYETATVRADVPRNAILPLGTLQFEGHPMPAPADPAALLSVSYGPNWRVPDPSFRHLPGDDTVTRFDDWFASFMTQRRDWQLFNNEAALQARDQEPSRFARWVTRQVPVGTKVLDLGSGASADVVFYAERGHRVDSYDFAHPVKTRLKAGRLRGGARLRRKPLNLLDERDAFTAGALAARFKKRQVVTAQGLIEALPPRSRETFWRFTSMALSRGGRAYLEGVSRSARRCKRRRDSGLPRLWPVDPADLVRQAEATGGRLVHSSGFEAAGKASRGGPPARWRMVVEWPEQEEV